ncbi:MAG: hypothetical protein SFX73_26440 [Kofleriaceae bacterium]|nr:hypothetical protein [Kofleriaceae bacterium]
MRSWIPLWLLACAGCGGGSTSAVDAAPGADGGSADYPYTLSPTAPGFEVSWRSGTLDCTMSAAQMAASDAAAVTVGASTIYVGWKQVAGNNQDPFIARVDDGTVTWCIAAEAQAPDGRAYGVVWDGDATLYAVYSTDGGGSALDGHGGWLPAYGTIGSGGGPKVAVIAKHDPATGAIQRATFVPSQLASSGKVNTLAPRALTVIAGGAVEFLGEPAFTPLNPDRSRMCVPDSEYPRGYRVRFPADLGTPSCADTETCSLVTTPCAP